MPLCKQLIALCMINIKEEISEEEESEVEEDESEEESEEEETGEAKSCRVIYIKLLLIGQFPFGDRAGFTNKLSRLKPRASEK